METISGMSNWRLTLRREEGGVVLLRAETCDARAVLPDRLFGLPVTALDNHALAPEGREIEGERLTITCGVPGQREWDNRRMEELTLPASLERVGNYAFLNCSALKPLRLHDGVTHWGSGALMNCRLLDTFFLTRTEPEQGPSLAYLAGELYRELDVTVTETDGSVFRLLFPEFVELYEENISAHHFDYFISGAGYPYHHCFRQKRLSLKEYDTLWRDFLGMEHDEAAAIRLAWFRLRWPVELGETAAAGYRAFLQSHAGEALSLLLEEEEAISLLVAETQPDRESLAAACALARERGKTAALAVLLEERNRRFPAGWEKSFAL